MCFDESKFTIVASYYQNLAPSSVKRACTPTYPDFYQHKPGYSKPQVAKFSNEIWTENNGQILVNIKNPADFTGFLKNQPANIPNLEWISGNQKVASLTI